VEVMVVLAAIMGTLLFLVLSRILKSIQTNCTYFWQYMTNKHQRGYYQANGLRVSLKICDKQVYFSGAFAA
jgi:hypothetical protein